MRPKLTGRRSRTRSSAPRASHRQHVTARSRATHRSDALATTAPSSDGAVTAVRRAHRRSHLGGRERRSPTADVSSCPRSESLCLSTTVNPQPHSTRCSRNKNDRATSRRKADRSTLGRVEAAPRQRRYAEALTGQPSRTSPRRTRPLLLPVLFASSRAGSKAEVLRVGVTERPCLRRSVPPLAQRDPAGGAVSPRREPATKVATR
jgi:hypothetical protein